MKRINLKEQTARTAFLVICYDFERTCKLLFSHTPTIVSPGNFSEENVKKMRTCFDAIKKDADSLIDIIDQYLLPDREGGEA